MLTPPDPPATATISVTVPAVATTLTDGLPPGLRAGRVRVTLPVLLTEPGSTRHAWLELDGERSPAVTLEPGRVSWVSATAVTRAGTGLSVRLVTDGAVLRSWRHRVAR